MVPFTFPIGVRQDWTLSNECELNKWKGQAMKADSKWEGLSLSSGKDAVCVCVCGKAGERCEGFFSGPVSLIHKSFDSHPIRLSFSKWMRGDELHPVRSNYGTKNWGYIECTSSIEIEVYENEVYWHRPQDACRVHPLETNPSLLICTRGGGYSHLVWLSGSDCGCRTRLCCLLWLTGVVL